MEFAGTDELKSFLDRKYKQYANPHFLAEDPIQIPHRFQRREDIEIAGILAATLAWGNRKSIICSASRLLNYMGSSPFEYVVNFDGKDKERLRGFVHRTFNGIDCINYISVLKSIYSLEGGLYNVFRRGFSEGESIFSALGSYFSTFSRYSTEQRSLKHVPNVHKGSAAKRMNMFLRWMVRPPVEGIDFGIWSAIPTSVLMVPLDVHTGTVGRHLGLLSRKQSDWRAVEELTASLREFDPLDPAKYDFALFGLGAYEKV